MGEGSPGQALTPEQLEAFRRKLEELDALGVPTHDLRAVLANRPQDFEREAEEALRREVQGGGEAPAGSAGGPLREAEEVRISGAGQAAAEIEEPVSEEEAASPPVETGASAVGEPAAAAPPAAGEATPAPGSLEELEAKLAAFVSAALPAAHSAPEPVVLEQAVPGPSGVETDLSEELAEALAEAPEPLSAPPPLSGGDALTLEAAPVATSRVTGEDDPKPPPPTGRAPLVAPQRVVVRSAAAPPGATPIAASAGASVEVLPTALEPRTRHARTAGAALAVLLLFAATYVLLINTGPAATFTFAPAEPVAGEAVAFSAAGTSDPNGDPITFRWQFGDGGNATGPSAVHTFARSGTYTVTLSATDDHKNTGAATRQVSVTAGTITPPVYRFADRVEYDVQGNSHVEGLGAPLATVNFTLLGSPQSCDITAVDLLYTGPQSRLVLPSPAAAKDGFLDEHNTYVLERSLPALQLDGQINTTCPRNPPFSGTAAIHERSFENLDNNDTVRSESDEEVHITVETDISEQLDSSASLTDYPELARAAQQLHVERIYAGRPFSTENVSSGNFTAEGLSWLWITQGTEVVAGSLAVKIHLDAVNLPLQITKLTTDLWVSSSSSFPLKEEYFVRGVGEGKTYVSRFTATATGPGVAGADPIAFGSGARDYRDVLSSELAPMTQVPRATAGADFNFTPRSAFDESVSQCADFATFVVDNPNAYSVNGTYDRATGNPRWMLEFAQDSVGERKRTVDEHSATSQVRCSSGAVGAAHSRAEIGQVVSLNYAADLLKQEPTASALFPAHAFDATRANFTIKQDVKLPSVSFNAALAASRAAIPFAFGVETFPSAPARTTAYVDAQTGQLVFVLYDTGDRLP